MDTATAPPETPAQPDSTTPDILGGAGSLGNSTEAPAAPPAQPGSTGDLENRALAARTSPAPVAQPPESEHKSFLSDLLHAVGEVFAPSTTQRVNPQTGAIEKVPLNTGQRVVGGVLQGLRGAGAGLAQHGPGSLGRSVVAGSEAQQQANQAQQQRLQAESQNVRQTDEAAQQKQLTQANLAKLSQDQARTALDMKAKKQELDEHQTALAESLQELMNAPGAKLLQHFDSNDDINQHLETVGPQLAKQYAIDMARNNIRLVQNPKGGFDAIEVPKKAGETPIGEGHKVYQVTPDPKHLGQLMAEPQAADPSMTWDQYNAANGNAMSAYNSAQESQTKIAAQKAQQEHEKAETTKANVETQIAAQNAGIALPGQKQPPAENPAAIVPTQAANGSTVRKDTAFLSSLSPQRRDLLDEIGTGHMVPERMSYMLGRPDGQVLAAQLSRAYPDWDSSKAQAYPQVYKEFTSTKSGAGFQINAGATAIKHLREAHDLNTSASHVPGTQAYRRYQTAINTLAPELAKFYGDTTIPAIQGFKDQFNTSIPGNRNAAIKQQIKLMGKKFDNYEQQWKNAAPSPAYEAEMPGVDTETKNARAALDPEYATRIAPKGGPPSGATNEVYAQDGKTVIGHVVNGAYVPAQ